MLVVSHDGAEASKANPIENVKECGILNIASNMYIYIYICLISFTISEMARVTVVNKRGDEILFIINLTARFRTFTKTRAALNRL